MIRIRPATYADLAAVDGTPPARTSRSMVAEEDGKVIGLWGIYPLNTRYVLFSSLTPAFRRNKRHFALGVAAARRLIASRPPMPVIAQADPEIAGSDVLLKHMGFIHLHGSTYQWHG